MGLFRVVETELECEGCGAAYRAEVRFKTGADYGPNLHYRAGQIASDLEPGSTYEGRADAFCPACMAEWVHDERSAEYEELARWIEEGEITATLGTYQTLTPDEVRSLAEFPESSRLGMSAVARLSSAGIVLFRGQAVLEQSPSDWWWAHIQRVRDRLATMGWRAPADRPYMGISVRIDDKRRVVTTLA